MSMLLKGKMQGPNRLLTIVWEFLPSSGVYKKPDRFFGIVSIGLLIAIIPYISYLR